MLPPTDRYGEQLAFVDFWGSLSRLQLQVTCCEVAVRYSDGFRRRLAGLTVQLTVQRYYLSIARMLLKTARRLSFWDVLHCCLKQRDEGVLSVTLVRRVL